MRKSFIASTVYLALGLIAGVFYREYTKAYNFPEGSPTQLSVLHTHLLTLGFLFFLIVLVLDKQFNLSEDSRFKTFFWSYNAGLVITIGIMTWHGILTVQGVTDISKAIPGIAGLGHVLLGLGLTFFMLTLGSKLKK
jgi:hypothetical protein